jgi:Na+/proline symporter
MAIAINLPVLCVFMTIGLLLHIFYQRPDLMGAAAPLVKPQDSRQVFLSFILNEMPPGMSGLMMAGLFAAGLGSCNSAINAMAAAFVNDWYRKIAPGQSDAAYLRVGRFAVVGWGVVLGSFAAVCVYWQEGSGQTLLQFALSVMNFAYAGLLGVFFTAIFFKSRGNGMSAIAALVVGFSVVALLQKWAIAWWAPTLGLKTFAIAFPWVLLIATVCSTGVCVLGKPRRGGIGAINEAR